ncbi:hypothetical protein MKEN_01326000 [Mycena kentingensis (nom. inval.)]|nr:hypothetical protein MKEN_01326000 [Mycena kentingensis (nom. inval.)]
MASSLFPSSVWQSFIAVGYLLGITILTFFSSRRIDTVVGGAKTWPRVCTLLIFLDSYMFMFSYFSSRHSGLRRWLANELGFLCLSNIYAFLTEKVYIVWDTSRPRLRSPVYLVCMATVGLYTVIVIAMVIGRIAHFRPRDGACVIGLKPTASLPLLVYDLFINVLLTSLFLFPLFRNSAAARSDSSSAARLRKVAVRTLVAAVAGLTTSTVNIAVLTLMHGTQLGWVCLASCGTDVWSPGAPRSNDRSGMSTG